MVFVLYRFQLQNNAIVGCGGGLIDILYKKVELHSSAYFYSLNLVY